MMKKYLIIGLIGLAIFNSGCGSMFKGDKGDSGVSLIKTYIGNITGATVQNISVPEIQGNPDTTYVMVYYAFNTSPTTWTQITDGWLDSSAQCYWVSWVTGNVGIYQGFTNCKYMIKVYGNK